jgi:hypothetical protein
VQWDPDTGEVRCPAGTTEEQAEKLWDQVRAEMGEWLLDVMEEGRQGRPTADAKRTAGHA